MPVTAERLPDTEDGFPLSTSYKKAEVLYLNGNYDDTFPLFNTLADQGDPLAQYRGGEMYDLGRGVGENPRPSYRASASAAS